MADKRVLSRMKKELERLKNDPPHGVTCWCKQGKLNNLEASLMGAEGTPYEGGLFKLDIEIPNNYPFQPPHVQFLTRIYHPNIDTAGRICLDVLKSPPTGSWKPAHNLHTILTSIQQLLVEPNPDDGLMADISVEYKQRRPTFVSKAKEWTCKYAKGGLPPTPHSSCASGDSAPQILSEPSKDTQDVSGASSECEHVPKVEDVVKIKGFSVVGRDSNSSVYVEGTGTAVQPIVIDDMCVTFTKEEKRLKASLNSGREQDSVMSIQDRESGQDRKRSRSDQDRGVKRKKLMGEVQAGEGHTKKKLVIEL